MDANRHEHREKINRSPEILRGEIYSDTGTVERCLACEAERSEQIFNSRKNLSRPRLGEGGRHKKRKKINQSGAQWRCDLSAIAVGRCRQRFLPFTFHLSPVFPLASSARGF